MNRFEILLGKEKLTESKEIGEKELYFIDHKEYPYAMNCEFTLIHKGHNRDVYVTPAALIDIGMGSEDCFMSFIFPHPYRLMKLLDNYKDEKMGMTAAFLPPL